MTCLDECSCKKDVEMRLEKIVEFGRYLEDRRENANNSKGIGFVCDLLGFHGSKALWLDYYGKLSLLHVNGDLHIHDMNKLSPYSACICMEKVFSGFNFNNVFDLFDQLFNFFVGMRREWAGAVHFEALDVFISPYINKISPTKENLIAALKSFLSNVASCDGFLSIGLDTDTFRSSMYECEKYNKYKKEMHLFNECLYTVLNGKRHFAFPIIHIGITDVFFKLSYCDAIFKNALTYGNTYFHNFFKGQRRNDFINMCCRLRIDKSPVNSKDTGSIGCVSINMARIGYLSRTKKELFHEIQKMVSKSVNILRKKEKLLNNLLNRGFYPLTSKYLIDFKHFYKTIGVNGINEMILNFTNGRFDITSEYGIALGEESLNFVRTEISKLTRNQELIHLEATPCEGASTRFAQQDIKSFGKVFYQGKNFDDAHYTNSSQIPDGYSDDLFKNLELQSRLQQYYNGGTVFHIFINSKEYDIQSGKKLLKKIFSNFSIPTVTYSPSFYSCENHGYIAGNDEYCSLCGNKMQLWGRVMGYMRPINDFSNSKRSEFFARKVFKNKEG